MAYVVRGFFAPAVKLSCWGMEVISEHTFAHNYERTLIALDYVLHRTAGAHLEAPAACPNVGCAPRQGARLHLGNIVNTDYTDVLLGKTDRLRRYQVLR